MDILRVIAEFFSTNGIDPVLGGFIVGVILCVMVRMVRVSRSRPPTDRRPSFKQGPITHGEFIFSKQQPLHAQLKIQIAVNGQNRELDHDGSNTILGYIKSGNKREAIKYLRELSDMGLKEAKDLVDLMERANL